MGWALPPIELAAARKARAVCAAIRAKARVGADKELAAMLGDLAGEVRDTEPGCLSYVVTRALGSKTEFVVHAHFSNWTAFKRHGKTAHLERALPRLTALLAAPVSVEIFLEV